MAHDVRRLLDGPRPLRLNGLALPPGLRVLMVGPHPDDFDAVGVTMRLLRSAGSRLHVAVLTASSGVEDSFCPDPSPLARAALREAEQRASCAFFGLPPGCLEFPRMDEDAAGQVQFGRENAARLEALVGRTRPDVIVLPHGHDSNTGHQRVAAMIAELVGALDRAVALLLIRDPKTLASRIDLYTDFDDGEVGWKAELLRHHRSQQQRNLNTRGRGFDDRILDANRAIAREVGAGADYAEGFELQ